MLWERCLYKNYRANTKRNLNGKYNDASQNPLHLSHLCSKTPGGVTFLVFVTMNNGPT